MSGAQAKASYKIVVEQKMVDKLGILLFSFLLFQFCFQAAVICGCIGIVAETSYEALKKRFDQGWVLEMIDDVETLITRVIKAKKNKEVNRKYISK